MTSKMFLDLVVEDESALNAIANGAQCTLSQLDGNKPMLQVCLSPQLSSPASSIPRLASHVSGGDYNSLRHMEIHRKPSSPAPPPPPLTARADSLRNQSGTHLFISPADGSVVATASKCLSFSY
jgi:hypothetical protein